MSYIMIRNNAGAPVHAALSWNGIQQQCRNDIMPGATHDFVVGLGWHDLTVVPGVPGNRFARSANNKIDVGRFLVETAELTGLGAMGRVLAGGDVFDEPFLVGFQGIAPNGHTPARLSVADGVTMHPVATRGLYAPDGYTITVTGSTFDGTYDEATDTFRIEQVTPLTMACWNRNTRKTVERKVART